MTLPQIIFVFPRLRISSPELVSSLEMFSVDFDIGRPTSNILSIEFYLSRHPFYIPETYTVPDSFCVPENLASIEDLRFGLGQRSCCDFLTLWR
jgi:hypothetical protein